MPLYQETNRDKPFLFDGLTKFRRVSSFDRVSEIEPDAVAGSVNMDLDQGTIRTRRGLEAVGTGIAGAVRVQGIGYLDTASPSLLQLLLIIVDQVPYVWDGSAWSATSGYTPPTASQRVIVAPLVDKLFLATAGYNVRSWDGAAFVDLGSGGTDEPKQYGIICAFTFRLFGAGIPDLPDTLECSDILDATVWKPLTNSSRVGGGESDPITALCGWQNNQLVVGKRNSVWIVICEPTQQPADWVMKRVVKDAGCVEHKTMCQVGEDIFWLARDGVRSMQYTLQGETQGVSEPISRAIQDVIDQINWPVIDTASACYWRNRYILSVPLGDSTEANAILVYNTITQGWTGTWTGWNAAAFIDTYFDGAPRLMVGRGDGTVGQWMEYVTESLEGPDQYKDFGVEFASAGETRAMTCSELLSPKQGFSAQAEFWKSQADAALYVKLDGGGSQLFWSGATKPPGGSMVGDPIPWILGSRKYWRIGTDLQHFGSWREIQFRLECEGGKVQLRSLYLAARVEKFEAEINV